MPLTKSNIRSLVNLTNKPFKIETDISNFIFKRQFTQ